MTELTYHTSYDTAYHFNPDAIPDRITDRNGNSATLTYGGEGCFTTNSKGKTCTLYYNFNLLEAVIKP
ncbi:hypothetical protein [Phosphitispora fastidiosa]|uniref:hypothetical protein n=1 Tax=Phosphitispora fastidiosa TaxID=2837202 RepID=UPI001E2F3832|nr:hypothetical protein [Phosphitispora fastidiosa]MBU7008028.1 hypothetical protein [Phosphitispora fastidiosa]